MVKLLPLEPLYHITSYLNPLEYRSFRQCSRKTAGLQPQMSVNLESYKKFANEFETQTRQCYLMKINGIPRTSASILKYFEVLTFAGHTHELERFLNYIQLQLAEICVYIKYGVPPILAFLKKHQEDVLNAEMQQLSL
jgi:hypothetical protein